MKIMYAIQYLYTEGEEQEAKEACALIDSLRYLSTYMQKRFKLSIDDVTIGKEPIGEKYKGVFQRTTPVGVISSEDPAFLSDKILSDRHLERFGFNIAGGANSSGGIDREKGVTRYNFSLNSQTWNSYDAFVNDFTAKNKAAPVLNPVRGQNVDYIVIKGFDRGISDGKIIIELGNRIKQQTSRWRLPIWAKDEHKQSLVAGLEKTYSIMNE